MTDRVSVRSRRWLVVLLAALVAVVMAVNAGPMIAPAAHASGGQNRARAQYLAGGTQLQDGGPVIDYDYDPAPTSTTSSTNVAPLTATGEAMIAEPSRAIIGAFRGFSATEDAGALADPAASRVYLRVGTRQAIQDAAPRTADGDFIDPNTGQVIPQEGPFDYGHTPGNEWWRTQQMAREQGWTRQQVIEYENDPSHYQIEDPSSNRSHLYEAP